jgi:hypothetical protein
VVEINGLTHARNVEDDCTVLLTRAHEAVFITRRKTMREVNAIFAGSVGVLLLAGSAFAQTSGYQNSGSNGYSNRGSSGYSSHQDSDRDRDNDRDRDRNYQHSGYSNSGSPNNASTALSNLYQARDELNSMKANPHRDQALHDIYAAIDETKALSNSSSSGHRR